MPSCIAATENAMRRVLALMVAGWVVAAGCARTVPEPESNGVWSVPEDPIVSQSVASGSPVATTVATPTTTPPPARPAPTVIQTVRARVSRVPGAGDHATAVAFLDAKHGWLSVGTRILATRDGGEHWSVTGDLGIAANYLSFTSRKRGWAATAAGLLVTNDGGATWRVPAGELSRSVRKVQFIDDQHGWIAAGWLLRTSDGGVSWQRVEGPCFGDNDGAKGSFSFVTPDVGWLQCASVPGAGWQGKNLYRTVDGGIQWTPMGKENGFSPGYVQDLVFRDEVHGVLSLNRGITRVTDDGGLTWRSAHLPIAAEGFSATAGFSTPMDGYALSTIGWRLVLTTSDGGANWKQVFPPLAPGGTSAMWLRDGASLIGEGGITGPRLLESTDGGRSWHHMQSNVSEWRGQPKPGIYAIGRFSFSDPNHGWAVGTVNEGSGDMGAVLTTDDGGHHWRPRFKWPPSSLDQLDGVHGIDALTAYAWNRAGALFLSRDGGDTFAPVGPFGAGSRDYQFTSVDAGWKIQNDALYSTNDGGYSWTSVPLGYRIRSYQLLPGGHAWVVASGCHGSLSCSYYLLKTSDRGKTWTIVDLGVASPLSLNPPRFSDPEHGWISDERGNLYRTEDGGLTWVHER
jgi:photosystem II stability/assembly factor-like uncharacterized protein